MVEQAADAYRDGSSKGENLRNEIDHAGVVGVKAAPYIAQRKYEHRRANLCRCTPTPIEASFTRARVADHPTGMLGDAGEEQLPTVMRMQMEAAFLALS
jgi:hypothetical protein